MSRFTPFALTLAALLFSTAALGETCQDASRTASQVAQDYRQAVGKVKLACDRASDACEQARMYVQGVLNLLHAANQNVLAACLFVVPPPLDDALPATAGTVTAAIDSLPESVLMPCQTLNVQGGEVLVGCPNGSLINVPRSALMISSGSMPNTFNYAVNLNVSGAIPVSASIFGVATSCTLNVSTATGVPVTGTAVFSSSEAGGTLNRLQLGVSTFSTQSLAHSGCAVLGVLLDAVLPFVEPVLVSNVTSLLSQQFCGAVGPELFGPCP